MQDFVCFTCEHLKSEHLDRSARCLHEGCECSEMLHRTEDALAAWQEWWQESGAADHWWGPCAHGALPYDRCDTCGELDEEDAQLLAQTAKQSFKQ